MTMYKVDVDGRTFFLAGLEAIASFKAMVVRAIRDGGDFVDVRTASEAQMSVLVSSGSSVSLESTGAAYGGAEGDSGHANAFDGDEMSDYLSDFAALADA